MNSLDFLSPSLKHAHNLLPVTMYDSFLSSGRKISDASVRAQMHMKYTSKNSWKIECIILEIFYSKHYFPLCVFKSSKQLFGLGLIWDSTATTVKISISLTSYVILLYILWSEWLIYHMEYWNKFWISPNASEQYIHDVFLSFKEL